jgi:hypothetical protein
VHGKLDTDEIRKPRPLVAMFVGKTFFLGGSAVLPDDTCIFKPKNYNLGNFFRSCNGISWYFLVIVSIILWPNGIFYGHLVHFVVIWYIFNRFGIESRKIWQSWGSVTLLPTFFTTG